MTKLEQDTEKFWSKLDKTSDHWLWTGKSLRGSLGYGAVRLPLSFGLGRKMESSHRVSFYLTHGYWPSNARHTCDIPLCCHPDHLIEGTQADNIDDCRKRNRARNGNIKLNPTIWEAIRQSTESSTVLGKQYGVHPAHIRKIRRGVSGIEYRP